MRIYLMSLAFDIWDAVKISYKAPTTSPIDSTGKKLSEINAKGMNAIFWGMVEFEFIKFKHWKSEKRYVGQAIEYMWRGWQGKKRKVSNP